MEFSCIPALAGLCKALPFIPFSKVRSAMQENLRDRISGMTERLEEMRGYL